jgi:DNA-binding CsgD family transcriptional regulator
MDSSAPIGVFRLPQFWLAKTGDRATALSRWRRVAAAHVVALLATVVVLAIDGGAEAQTDALLMALPLFVGFAVLHVMSVNRMLAISTLILDAVGIAVFLAGTAAPASAYYFLALACAWWAAHVPRRGSGLVWAVAFVAAYGVLVLPSAVGDRLLVHALEDVSVVVIVALLSDWFVRVDRRALELSEALARAPAGAEKIAIRDGLTRAMGPIEISLDVMLAAARAGLTVIQAELLAYLQMGLTNQELADATNVGEATVRYRLTRLYRALGVRGRKEAVRRAMALGIASSSVDATTGNNT